MTDKTHHHFTWVVLTAYRSKQDWTLEKLGQRLGITKQAVDDWKIQGIPDAHLPTVVALLKIPHDEITQAMVKDYEEKIIETLYG